MKSEPDKRVDIHVGGRVRLRRKLLDMSQQKLGTAVGVAYQQIQKYEHGTSHIGAGRLWHIGRALEVPVEFFYDDMPPAIAGRAPPPAETPANPVPIEMLAQPETMALVRAYYRISNLAVRKRVLKLVKAVGIRRRRPKA